MKLLRAVALTVALLLSSGLQAKTIWHAGSADNSSYLDLTDEEVDQCPRDTSSQVVAQWKIETSRAAGSFAHVEKEILIFWIPYYKAETIPAKYFTRVEEPV
ncbi:hypothetical protein [Xanthomonas phage JGB6]|nr:hypothetical protein [Xanthomonas phage JGB6]